MASRLAAATVIMDLIEANGHGFVIGEDFMARPTDRWLKPVPTTLVAYDQVYQWSGTTDVPFDTAHEIVDLSNRTFVSNIIVAAPDGAEAYMAPSNRPEEIIDYAASHAVAVLVGAFDGEGYILWFPA
ncbi:MAG: hypothetical protein GY720_15730 [bacterium]|nr:hypothetical protein [bacterium]